MIAFAFLPHAGQGAPVWGGFQAVDGSQVVRPSLSDDETTGVIHFHAMLNMPQKQALQGLIDSGGQLSRDDLEAYLPSATEYATVKQWFLDQGFTLSVEDSTHHAVYLQGTVQQISAILGVQFARVMTATGETTYAVTAPTLPDDISPLVDSIVGLQPHPRVAHTLTLKTALSGNAADPAVIAAYYGATGAQTGAGQTIAIITDAEPSTSDLTTFWSVCGISQSLSNYTVVPIAGGPAAGTGNVGEATMDVEWASGIAPGAAIRLYACPAGLADESEAYVQVLNDLAKYPTIHQTSESYGGNEASTDPTFALLAAQGVSCFASTGDGGSNPNYAVTTSGGSNPYSATSALAVDYPAADPSVTAVGGTTLQLNSSGAAITAETAWSLGQQSATYATGGGMSKTIARPAWQVGTGVPSGTGRCVPDVSAIAYGMSGLSPFIVQGGAAVSDGGTSLACPIWAGFSALINQSRASLSLSSLGALNPQIYPLLGTNAFTDITVGNNGAYSAGAGYDLCTGLGTPIVSNLIAALSTSQTKAPSIKAQPVSETVVTGSSASFSVSAVGGIPLAYQWYLNGTALAAATTSTYTVSSVAAANAGAYTVKVSNSTGSVTSSAATLTVATPPGITSAMAAQTVSPGASVTFTVAATGSPTLTYQWSFGGASISGATNASYTLTNVTAAQAGIYVVTVTNPYGSLSTSVTLSVNSAPAITTQPKSQTVNAGTAVTFSVVATGTPAPTYQWKLGGTAISGATAASYTIASPQSANAGSYTVTVTNSLGSVTSTAAVLTVTALTAPTFTTQPASVTAVSGATVTLTSVATGNPAPTYQWYLAGKAISGATSATLTLSKVTSTSAGSYTVTAKNSVGSVTSSAATLTVTTSGASK